MATLFKTEIVSPEQVVWSGEAEIVVARGLDGEVGLLANHAPILVALGTGGLKVGLPGDQDLWVAVHGGFLQFSDNRCLVLTDQAEISTVADEEAARRRAEQLAEASDPHADTKQDVAGTLG